MFCLLCVVCRVGVSFSIACVLILFGDCLIIGLRLLVCWFLVIV